MDTTAAEIRIEGRVDLEICLHRRVGNALRRKRVHRGVVVLSGSGIVYYNAAVPVWRPLVADQLVVIPGGPFEQIPECHVRLEYIRSIDTTDVREIIVPQHLHRLGDVLRVLWIEGRQQWIRLTCNNRVTLRRSIRRIRAVVK